MDSKSKVLLEAALASWRSKGNTRLAEACAVALEDNQSKNQNKNSKLWLFFCNWKDAF